MNIACRFLSRGGSGFRHVRKRFEMAASFFSAILCLVRPRSTNSGIQDHGTGAIPRIDKLAIRAVFEVPEIPNQILQARPCRDHRRFNSALSELDPN